ncbi:cob(I)yrinic acid a,c-diamide adenosyltransferase [Phocea massiliensis]|uniref:Uncharacterized protein n=1 Tax=uncultured Anaerotruncus sp. TaxID=905011 RepID=A0A6N2V3Z2_9FIRM|nr:cob(I)yrinic acid a,c-diamide adenosyltransferase [Merdimmobilis hominis]MCD4837025.1 cob(I)yrinic acid a,c-diamide adenosyltransferase [Merdimmobilis hominis]
MNSPHLVHPYAGDGKSKSKTTAAIGQAIRGAGMRVLVCRRPTSERAPLEAMGLSPARGLNSKCC